MEEERRKLGGKAEPATLAVPSFSVTQYVPAHWQEHLTASDLEGLTSAAVFETL